MKRHTKQDNIQKHGLYFTENCDTLLDGFEHLVENRFVIDPFAGNMDLISWATRHNAIGYKAYDLFPLSDDVIENDSIVNPPNYFGAFLLSNPPYLSKNKNKNKMPYERWQQNDLYKCHLASLYPDIEDGILILPSNFLSESNDAARRMFFRHYTIMKGKYYYYSVFPKATTGIVVFSFRQNKHPVKYFPLEIHYKDRVDKITCILDPNYGYLYGAEFFDYIRDDDPLNIRKYDETSSDVPNTKIVISLLSRGKLPLGAHYNDGKPIWNKKSSFTTYQVSVDGIDLSENAQLEVIKRYNEKLHGYIDQYHGLFLANYMGADQKIKSRKYSNLLLSRIIKEIIDVG